MKLNPQVTDINADIFSSRRIVIAPIMCLTGYLMIIIGILRKGADDPTKQ